MLPLMIYNEIIGIVHDVIDSVNPTDLMGGVVVNTDPLQIEADINSDLYDGKSLVVPEYLTDSEYEVELDGSFALPFIHCTEGSVTNSGTGTYKGKMKFKNSLKVGDKIVMVKCKNGQEYFILDRVHAQR